MFLLSWLRIQGVGFLVQDLFMTFASAILRLALRLEVHRFETVWSLCPKALITITITTIPKINIRILILISVCRALGSARVEALRVLAVAVRTMTAGTPGYYGNR